HRLLPTFPTRRSSDLWFDEFNSHISVPVINAGAGALEHPTQCMIDLDTIYQEFGTFKGLNVVIVGDNRHSRVARSNVEALNKLGDRKSTRLNSSHVSI